MVFENVTLVELHVENSPFDAEGSPLGALRRFRRSEGEDETESEASGDESGGRRLRGPLTVLLLLAVGTAVVARRRRRSGEEPDAGEQISIEQAAEQ